MSKTHVYKAHIVWSGEDSGGTKTYQGYSREYEVQIDGKPTLHASADPAFRGRSDFHNPEDYFLAAISACHMLTYLALAARGGIQVLRYEDFASGTLELDPNGGGRFSEVTLHPSVTLAPDGDTKIAMALHSEAAKQCFIANSCRVHIAHDPRVEIGTAPNKGDTA